MGLEGSRNWMSAGEGPSGMLITCSFSIQVLGPWVFSVVKVHQAVHFSVCMLYSNKIKLRIFICQMIHYYGEK